MAKQQYIEEVARLVEKHAPQYGIKVYSPIIAQFCLECGYGTSNKVKKVLEDGTIDWRHNYAGLKWRNNRCAISNEYFEEGTAEQNKDGSYTGIVSKFYRFKSLEDCVIGYFQFTNISAYKNLKGVTDPEQYLINIKADKYATSIDYVQKNMNVIREWNLTKYDPQNTEDSKTNTNNNGGNKMVINVHAGHNPSGKRACGAVGILNESVENRIVKDKVIAMLRNLGHTVYDCTVDNGTSTNDVMNKIIAKCNAHTVDLDVSIHFNAGSNKLFNKVTTGTEVFLYSTNSKAKSFAQNVVNAISALGFKNRGVKISKTLAFLRRTKSPAMLIECCFVDDPDDANLYNSDNMAQAIVKGITGNIVVVPSTPSPSTNASQSTVKYTYKGVDYSPIFDPSYYSVKYPDLKRAFGTNATALFNHFTVYGMKEGRMGNENFNVQVYKANYKDLQNAFGEDLPSYYKHYIQYGKKEGRKAV